MEYIYKDYKVEVKENLSGEKSDWFYYTITKPNGEIKELSTQIEPKIKPENLEDMRKNCWKSQLDNLIKSNY